MFSAKENTHCLCELRFRFSVQCDVCYTIFQVMATYYERHDRCPFHIKEKRLVIPGQKVRVCHLCQNKGIGRGGSHEEYGFKYIIIKEYPWCKFRVVRDANLKAISYTEHRKVNSQKIRDLTREEFLDLI